MALPEPATTRTQRFVVLVVLCAVVPLGLLGLWTTRSAARSGRALLSAQLEARFAQTAAFIARRMDAHRADLLMLGENEATRVALVDTVTTDPPAYIERAFAEMTAFHRVTIRDQSGRSRWTLEAVGLTSNGQNGRRGDPERTITVRLPLTDLTSDKTIGSVEASLRAASLLPGDALVAQPGGPLTAFLVRERGIVVPSGVDERVFLSEDIEWAGHHWLTIRRRIEGFDVDLAIAGALDPVIGPFERSARQAAVVLLSATTIIVVILVAASRRMSRDVERELAHQEALATVGEFASELAHEVRNPLTAIRLELQRLEESETDDPTPQARSIVPRVLSQIDRMDRAVTGALRVARGGSIEPRSVDLRAVLEGAQRVAQPEFQRRGARLLVTTDDGAPLLLDGDAGALEQMFVNLLVNAAQALTEGGVARISAARHNGELHVSVSDNGRGMSAHHLADVERPFRSTRSDGTGLGLKIARRIIATHRGELTLRSELGVGTTVSVRLPAAGTTGA